MVEFQFFWEAQFGKIPGKVALLRFKVPLIDQNKLDEKIENREICLIWRIQNELRTQMVICPFKQEIATEDQHPVEPDQGQNEAKAQNSRLLNIEDWIFEPINHHTLMLIMSSRVWNSCEEYYDL